MRTLLLAACLAAGAAVLPAPAAGQRGDAAQPPELRFGEQPLATGVRLHYAVQGPADGEPVVLLHGLTDSWFSFSRVLPLLPERHRYFALDLRGHGDSDQPTADYGMRHMALDVLAFMNAQGIERFAVVGHSMGSLVAQQLAALAPERVTRLVLMASAANGDGLAPFDTMVQALTDPVPEAFIREFQLSTVYVPLPDAFLARVIEESSKVPARVWRGVMTDIMAFQVPPRLARVTVPTLIMWGDRDVTFPRAQQDALRARIPHARFLEFPEVGHALHWERPEPVAADLAAFLDTGR